MRWPRWITGATPATTEESTSGGIPAVLPYGAKPTGQRCTSQHKKRRGDRGFRCDLLDGHDGSHFSYAIGHGWQATEPNGDFVRYRGERCRSMYKSSTGGDYQCEQDVTPEHSHYSVRLGHGWAGGPGEDFVARW